MSDALASDELYRSTVCRMMESHGARIFSYAVVLGAALPYAPSASWLRFTGGQLRELTALFAQLSTLYEGASGVALAPPSLERGSDRAPPVSASWPDAVAAQLVAGRQCRWQLQEHDLCSYAPYREFVARAVAELDGRQSVIEAAVTEVARDPATAGLFPEALDGWLHWAVTAFGRPNTPGMAYAINVGLRRRDAGATLLDFLEDVRAIARASEVELSPRWRPEPDRPSLVAALNEIARAARDLE